MRPVLRLGAVFALLLGACAPPREIPPPEPPPPDVETPVPDAPRAVYIIHGDADYLYHDARGNRLHADEEALRQAREAARGASTGEVFIFHQRTGTMRRLWGSQRGLFEHYRSGALVESATYARSDPGFSAEAKLLHRVVRNAAPKTPAPDSARAPALVLAYFGHEIIPVDTVPGLPHLAADAPAENPGATRRLNTSDFKHGLRHIAAALGARTEASDDSSRPYAVVVLSTCYGGTPPMMRALAPLADFAVASPAYLHLSYLEARPLPAGRISTATPDIRRAGARRLADSVARASFERLRWQAMTEVTVAVYDLREARPPHVAPAPAARPDAVPAQPAVAASAERWRDCALEDASLLSEEAARGVTLHYQAPRFGAGKNTTARSPWQCPL
jgi:hypothetical protein